MSEHSSDEDPDSAGERSGCEEMSEDGEEARFLIDGLREIEKTTLLEELMLSRDGAGVGSSSSVPSLAVLSVVSIINADLSDDPTKREPKSVLIPTCTYLMKKIHGFGSKRVCQTGLDALSRALSIRIGALPQDRKYKLGGCTTLLSPPDTSGQILPSTVTNQVQDLLSMFKTMGLYARDNYRNNDGSLFSVEQLREFQPARYFNMAMMLMYKDYTYEQCLDAFLPPETGEYDDIDTWIAEFALCLNEEEDEEDESKGGKDNMKSVCAFAGIVKALKEKKERGEFRIYEEEEQEDMYDSWQVDEDKKPQKNDRFYTVQLGTILHFAEEQARKMVKDPPAGTVYSHPRAKFHQDLSKVEVQPKETDQDGRVIEEPNAQDVINCRAKHDYLDTDAFTGDDGVYSSRHCAHDETIGFSHTGAGWKCREFYGHLYGFQGETFWSREFGSEFWSTPSCIVADATNNTAWVHADNRIKGFTRDGTSYIFNVLKKPEASLSGMAEAGEVKRQKLDSSKKGKHGDENIIVFGSDRIGHLNDGVLQEWKLNGDNRHDGVNRIIEMGNWEEDIDQWPAEEILNLAENTWMDDTGEAEASIGVKPDSVRLVDIVTPSSIGYLPESRLAFANIGTKQIPLYNHELRETSRLFSFGGDDINIVRRPTFEKSGDGTTFVASDSCGVKIYDLRSGRPEVIIRQNCVSSTPVYLNDQKFLCNQLRGGKGAMMWDLRAQKPLYSLPITPMNNISWVPTCSMLLTGPGEYYKYGRDFPQDDEWESRDAKKAWAKLEEGRGRDGGDCCIM